MIRGGSFKSCFFFFSSRRRHTRLQGDWSSDVCSSDLASARWRKRCRHDLVDFLQYVWGRVWGSCKVLVALLAAPRPRQDDTHARAREHPSKRKTRQRHVEPPGDRGEPLDRRPPTLELPALEPIDVASVVGAGELRERGVLPAQQSRGEGPVCQERNPTLPAQRQLPLLHVPIEQVVGPLVRDHRRDLQCTRELAVGGVTEPHPQGLSLFLQRV